MDHSSCRSRAASLLNQLIRRPPLTVDLTLRTGNGGFVVLGAALAAAGLTPALARRVPRRDPHPGA